ncbi:hypothetical protein CAL26_09865 [Bordetella genomosp. 9]|uniref:DUF2815 domain-containing protein n=1 Tax=Bordetella genomosp. 9 TaxID=1416803 RepID=A0A261RFB1_9BORD|nr:ssDNA-binding protein [Bordetella genomosp. 9]OZI23728.1 hypothetical protein CAL26_09865 [Bordetella genomosp. 9]
MKVKLNKVRIAFAQQLTEAKPFEPGAAPAFGSTFLVPDNSALRKEIEKAMHTLGTEKWGAKGKGIVDNLLEVGDPKGCCYYPGKRKSYDGFEGNMALVAKRYEKDGMPVLLDADKSPLWDAAKGKAMPGKEGRIYSGCYVNATVDLWAQDNKYGKTIRCTLLGVQFADDGDSFGGTTKGSEDDFDDLGEGASSEDEDALA